ncbi:hypothetical protein PkoCFBP13504_07320 [Pseudomonas koreensis]|nr:hypothetical protein PkoCFBP13504_07320 [Pseudomonas koreensis]
MCRAIEWWRNSFGFHATHVGASLLAIAVYQSPFILTEPPLSRAGSLPQGLWCGANGICNLNPAVGASLLAKRPERTPSTSSHQPRRQRLGLQRHIRHRRTLPPHPA